MPVVRIEFDNQKIKASEALFLAKAVQGFVLKATQLTNVEDVVVYANNSQIKVAVHPIEIFLQVSAWKIKDIDALMKEIKADLQSWKTKHNFNHQITLSVSPEVWKIEVGI